jgi:hypothetical protein
MAILIIVGALILFYIVIKVYECYYYKKVDNEIPREIQISQGVEAMKLYDTDSIKEETTMEETKGTKSTRELFMETLTEIGCQYELSEDQDDDRIFFDYQGEHFLAGVNNDSFYVHIYDTYWGHVELYDIDEFSRLRKAVNESNKTSGVTTFYDIDEVGKNVDVHSKSIIPFMSEMPNLGAFLRVELNEFFRAHQCVKLEMAKQREAENA